MPTKQSIPTPSIILLVFIVLILILAQFQSQIDTFNLLLFLIMYLIPAIKMTRDLQTPEKHKKWCYYYAGVAFLTFVYYLISPYNPKIPFFALLLSFPLSFRDGALTAFIARILIQPFYILLKPVLMPLIDNIYYIISSVLESIRSLLKSLLFC